MKKLTMAALLLAVALILAACGGAGSGGGQQDDSDRDMGGMDHGQMDHGSMGMGSKGMARQMLRQNGKYSDRRFIDAMVPHHQGAIAMARMALKNAEHKEIKQLSRNIISTQKAEIEELKSIKEEEYDTSKVPMEMNQQQMQGMGMMDPHHLASEKPFDKAFIDAMIPHHRSAIYMARVASKESNNPRVRELARNIVSAQKKEIEQMKQWRKQWYPEG